MKCLISFQVNNAANGVSGCEYGEFCIQYQRHHADLSRHGDRLVFKAAGHAG